MADVTVPLDQDHEFCYDVADRAAATGASEGATGVTGLAACFATKDGDATTIIANTTTTLVARASKAAQYFGILDRLTLTTALSPSLRNTVYELVLRDGHVESSAPVRVAQTRRPL